MRKQFPALSIQDLQNLSQDALLTLLIEVDYQWDWKDRFKFGSEQWCRCDHIYTHGKRFLNEEYAAKFQEYLDCEDPDVYIHGDHCHDTSDMSPEDADHFWRGFYGSNYSRIEQSEHTPVKPCKHQMAVATWVLHHEGKTVIIEDNGER